MQSGGNRQGVVYHINTGTITCTKPVHLLHTRSSFCVVVVRYSSECILVCAAAVSISADCTQYNMINDATSILQ